MEEKKEEAKRVGEKKEGNGGRGGNIHQSCLKLGSREAYPSRF